MFLTYNEIAHLKYKSKIDVFRIPEKIECLEKQVHKLKEV